MSAFRNLLLQIRDRPVQLRRPFLHAALELPLAVRNLLRHAVKSPAQACDLIPPAQTGARLQVASGKSLRGDQQGVQSPRHQEMNQDPEHHGQANEHTDHLQPMFLDRAPGMGELVQEVSVAQPKHLPASVEAHRRGHPT